MGRLQEKALLRKEVKTLKRKLIKLEIKNPRHYFCKRYPEYKDEDGNYSAFLNNLWYGRSSDKEFNDKLRAFVELKEQQEKQ